jgi:hypothetical protein
VVTSLEERSVLDASETEQMHLGEATQVASTVFAAVAGVGSATAAWVIYRQWRASSTPALSVDLVEVLPKGTIFLNVVNYGGPTKKVSFAVIEGEQACLSFLPPHGFLGPGDSRQVQICVDSAGSQQAAVVYGFDLEGRYVHAWAANGTAQRWRARSSRWRRRPTDLSAVSILQRFYPGAPDPTTLELKASVLMPPDDR